MAWTQNEKKLIIFDCDGVLVDSEILVTRFLIHHLQQYHFNISLEDWIKRFTGKTDDRIYHEINQELKTTQFTKELIGMIQQQIHQRLRTELLFVKGMPQLLETLKNAGERFCVASSGTIKKIHTSLTTTGLKHYFQDHCIFSAQSVQHGKPAPDLFLFVAEQMNYPPKSCIVIEDSLAGITAAQAAGMKVFGFLGGSHAQYSWYKDNMMAFDIPIVENAEELLTILYTK